ncbi:MAG: hypothetical protein ABUS56_04350 [Acidobacteriota bacterium]
MDAQKPLAHGPLASTALGSGVPLLVGAVVAASLQGVAGWWLNSGRGVAVTLAGVFACAVLFAWRGGGSRRRAAALWVGVMAGLAACLVATGPGTIWPIVLVVSAGLTAVTTLAGTRIGGLLHHRRGARP